MRNKKALLIGTIIFSVCLAGIFNAFAHSGRTDGNGGHRDNNNTSGLGYYHYHCGGYPAHLHTGGVCPYRSGASYSSSSSSSYSSTSSSKYDEGYEDGLDAGYDAGHTEGYNEGYDKGYDEGYDKGYEDGYKDRSNEFADASEKELKFILYLILAIVAIVPLAKFIKKHRKK